MLKLKTTEEYRTDSELEAKEAMEQFRAEANEKGYEISGEKEYDINREVVIDEVEEQPDSHNQEQYLLPQFLKGKKRSRIL